jgi:hypothetical protein
LLAAEHEDRKPQQTHPTPEFLNQEDHCFEVLQTAAQNRRGAKACRVALS